MSKPAFFCFRSVRRSADPPWGWTGRSGRGRATACSSCTAAAPRISPSAAAASTIRRMPTAAVVAVEGSSMATDPGTFPSLSQIFRFIFFFTFGKFINLCTVNLPCKLFCERKRWEGQKCSEESYLFGLPWEVRILLSSQVTAGEKAFYSLPLPPTPCRELWDIFFLLLSFCKFIFNDFPK